MKPSQVAKMVKLPPEDIKDMIIMGLITLKNLHPQMLKILREEAHRVDFVVRMAD